jgi:hypothetical protein
MKLATWKYFSLIMALVLAIGTGMTAFNPSPAAAAAPPDPTWWARYGAQNENQPRAIVADSQGNVYVTGYSNTGGYDVYATAKYGSGYIQGQAPAWAKTWKLAGVAANFTATAIAVDSTGVYVTGCGHDGSYNYSYYTLKYDLATGAELWASPATCVGEESNSPPHIAVDNSGVYVTGSTWIASEDYVTIKYNKGTGATLWGPVYYDGGASPPDNDYSTGIAVNSSGVYVTGLSEVYYEPDDDVYFDITTIRYDLTTGAQLWVDNVFTWDSSTSNKPYIAVDSSGVYVTGTSYLLTNRDYVTIKYPLDSATPLWGPVYYNGGFGQDKPKGIAVDSTGVYVTGNMRNGSGKDNYCTIKYGLTDGLTKWAGPTIVNGAAIYAGTGLACDDWGIAVDSSGVYVTGYIRATTSPQFYKYATVKYALSDGSEVWPSAALFSGDSFSYGCYAYAIAADGGGGVYVTGYNYYDASDHFNYLTVKYGTTSPGPAPATASITSSSINTTLGTINLNINNGSLANVSWLAPAAIRCSTPGGYTFPYGMFSFNITGLSAGQTARVTLKFPNPLPLSTKYYKCINGNMVDCTSLVTRIDPYTLVLALTDGGLGDADGTANGIIVDPGGPAFALSTTPATHQSSIPAAPQAPVSLSNIKVKSASLSATKVSPGTPVTVTANVANTGTGNGTSVVKVYVNGAEEAQEGVTVNSGGTSTVTFDIIRNDPGTYSVYVGGTNAGSYKIEAFNESDIILISSIVFVGLAFILGVIMLWRRQRTEY